MLSRLKLIAALVLFPLSVLAQGNFSASSAISYSTNGSVVSIAGASQNSFGPSNFVDVTLPVSGTVYQVNLYGLPTGSVVRIAGLSTNSTAQVRVGLTNGAYLVNLRTNQFCILPMDSTNLFLISASNTNNVRVTSVPPQ